MKFAFYIGDHKKDAGLLARLGVIIIRIAQTGAEFADATHVEGIIEEHEDGTVTIGSATMRKENLRTGGNGVRCKRTELTPGHWRVYDMPAMLVQRAIAILEQNDGLEYDLKGAVASAVAITRDAPNARFCSDICAEMMGLHDPSQFTPAELEAIASSLGTDITFKFFSGIAARKQKGTV